MCGMEFGETLKSSAALSRISNRARAAVLIPPLSAYSASIISQRIASIEQHGNGGMLRAALPDEPQRADRLCQAQASMDMNAICIEPMQSAEIRACTHPR